MLAFWLRFYVRQLNRPLRFLELAARRIGRGGGSRSSAWEAPRSFRQLPAFNQMNSNLQQVERERQLLLAGNFTTCVRH